MTTTPSPNERSQFPPWVVLSITCGFVALLLWQARDAARSSGPLHPAFHVMHFKFGEFWLDCGEPEQASAAFERALRNNPQALGAHVALAVIAQGQNRRDDAMAHLRQALAISPEHAEANASLGVLLLGEGKVREACDQFTAALATDARHHAAMANLAWIKATSTEQDLRDGELALELATRASNALDDRDPKQLIIVAAAKAETGDFGGAIGVAERALKLAEDFNAADMVSAVQFHLEKYRAGQPLRFSMY